MKSVAVISDISGVGNCSLSACLPVISALRCQCLPVPTSVYTNQTGYDSYKCEDLTKLLSQFAGQWKNLGVKPDAILTGFIPTAKQVAVVKDFLTHFPSAQVVVVDPSMAEGGVPYNGFGEQLQREIANLCKLADVITPNVSEFCLLTSTNYHEFCSMSVNEKLEAIKTGSERLFTDRLKAVIVTGVKCDSNLLTVTCTPSGTSTVSSPNYPGEFSGTGDLFSASVTALLTRDMSLKKSVITATAFLTDAVSKTLTHQHNPLSGVDFQDSLDILTGV